LIKTEISGTVQGVRIEPSILERYLYDKFCESLIDSYGEPIDGPNYHREKVKSMTQEEIHEVLQWAEFWISQYGIKLDQWLSQDTIKIAPQKLKTCEVCGSLFYDLSRNGRTKVCHYRKYEWFNQTQKKVQQRKRNGRIISLCERRRDDADNVRRYNGSACSYTVSTRERLERQMFVWTSFQPSKDEPEQYISQLLMGPTDGNKKKGIIVAKDWPH
jgi:hypothetical protein